jgi:Mg2+/Co2+ transporter CorB
VGDLPIGTLLVILGLLLVLSGFFSMAETSMMAVNRYRLRHLASKGHRGARLAEQLLSRTDRLLGVMLLGNAFLNAAAATLASVITVRLVGAGEFALTIATLLVTLAILVLSEVTPKVLGAAYAEPIALVVSYILGPLLRLFYPAVWFVNLFVQALLWLTRLKPSNHGEAQPLSMEELRTLVLEGAHYIPAKHQTILINLFGLEDITVDDVMTPRHLIEAIDIDDPIEEVRTRLATSHHTMQPVYSRQLDEIVGVLHVRKVLHQAHASELTVETLHEIMRPPYFIPAGTPLLTQLQNFQESHRRVGLVVDEYGELQGLVTVDDILEEIVGEFSGRALTHARHIHRESDNVVLVEGGCSLRELNRKLGVHFGLDGPKTINGRILEHLEDIPETGTSVKIDGYPIEIVQTQDRMVRMVRIQLTPIP